MGCMNSMTPCSSETGAKPEGLRPVLFFFFRAMVMNLPTLGSIALMLANPWNSAPFQFGLALTLLQAWGEGPRMAKARHSR